MDTANVANSSLPGGGRGGHTDSGIFSVCGEGKERERETDNLTINPFASPPPRSSLPGLTSAVHLSLLLMLGRVAIKGGLLVALHHLVPKPWQAKGRFGTLEVRGTCSREGPPLGKGVTERGAVEGEAWATLSMHVPSWRRGRCGSAENGRVPWGGRTFLSSAGKSKGRARQVLMLRESCA